MTDGPPKDGMDRVRSAAAGPARAEIVVVGAGILGLWTALTLRERRHQVLLVDAWAPGHLRAASSGETRIIRSGYGGSDLYAGWAWRAVKLWTAWQQRTGSSYFHKTGVLWLAGRDESYAEASRKGLERLRAPHERLERPELERRYPQFSFRGIPWGLFEPEAGAIQARRACIALAGEFARDGGMIVRAQVRPGKEAASGLADLVGEDGSRIQGDAFVFACGPWLVDLFPDLLAEKISVTRKEVFFFGTPPGDGRFASGAMPAWLELGTGCYGVPEIDGRGLKVAPDLPGRRVHPDTLDRKPTAALLKAARNCLRRRLPDMRSAPLAETRVCQYASTADDHLIFDRHPRWANAWILGAGSGHAFKHGPVIGEMAADVATGAHPASDIPAPLRLDHRPEGRNF